MTWPIMWRIDTYTTNIYREAPHGYGGDDDDGRKKKKKKRLWVVFHVNLKQYMLCKDSMCFHINGRDINWRMPSNCHCLCPGHLLV